MSRATASAGPANTSTTARSTPPASSSGRRSAAGSSSHSSWPVMRRSPGARRSRCSSGTASSSASEPDGDRAARRGRRRRVPGAARRRRPVSAAVAARWSAVTQHGDDAGHRLERRRRPRRVAAGWAKSRGARTRSGRRARRAPGGHVGEPLVGVDDESGGDREPELDKPRDRHGHRRVAGRVDGGGEVDGEGGPGLDRGAARRGHGEVHHLAVAVPEPGRPRALPTPANVRATVGVVGERDDPAERPHRQRARSSAPGRGPRVVGTRRRRPRSRRRGGRAAG